MISTLVRDLVRFINFTAAIVVPAEFVIVMIIKSHLPSVMLFLADISHHHCVIFSNNTIT